jgi:hypothetical protein
MEINDEMKKILDDMFPTPGQRIIGEGTTYSRVLRLIELAEKNGKGEQS